jgi:hypothetical protein
MSKNESQRMRFYCLLIVTNRIKPRNIEVEL